MAPKLIPPYVDPPCDAKEAVDRATRYALERKGQYLLGTGGFNPDVPDDPLTWRGSLGRGTDCAGFAICWAWKLKRHRVGFNKGRWATVSDDINTNSAIEDADHKRELFLPVEPEDLQPGDILAWPSFQLRSKDRKRVLLNKIGHCCIVTRVPSAYTPGNFTKLEVAQSHGPDKFSPGAVLTDGSVWSRHDIDWPKPEHRTRILRPRSRP